MSSDELDTDSASWNKVNHLIEKRCTFRKLPYPAGLPGHCRRDGDRHRACDRLRMRIGHFGRLGGLLDYDAKIVGEACAKRSDAHGRAIPIQPLAAKERRSSCSAGLASTQLWQQLVHRRPVPTT